MNMNFEDYKDVVKAYCLDNHLNFNKILTLPKSGNRDFILVAHSDGLHDGSRGLLDDTPMPCVLIINNNYDGSVSVRQTEHTRKYISA
jgi:hypothetical protein